MTIVSNAFKNVLPRKKQVLTDFSAAKDSLFWQSSRSLKNWRTRNSKEATRFEAILLKEQRLLINATEIEE